MERDGLLTAVWIALFLAVSAWLGAWLFRGTGGQADTEKVLPERADSICLSGIAIRREEALSFGLSPVSSAPDGRRIPAGGAVACFSDGSTFAAPASCVYFADCDGYEYLSPEDGENITVSELSSLLALPPGDTGCCRIVTDYVWYYAAVTDGECALSEKKRYTLCFEGMGGTVPAQAVSVSEPLDGRRAILFRLTAGGDYLRLRKCECELRLQ